MDTIIQQQRNYGNLLRDFISNANKLEATLIKQRVSYKAVLVLVKILSSIPEDIRRLLDTSTETITSIKAQLNKRTKICCTVSVYPYTKAGYENC